MTARTLLPTAIVLLLAAVAALGQPALTHEGPLEVLVLDDMSSAKAWSAAECEVSSDTTHVKVPPASLHWGVPVDWTTGEPNYPIGWPRTPRDFPEAWQRDWSSFDMLEFWVYTTSSRDKLPNDPAGFIIRSTQRGGDFTRELTELKLNEWVRFRLPTADIATRDSVRGVQFYISESNYRDKDRVDFYISPLRLLRYAEPVLDKVELARPAIYAGARGVPVFATVLGIKPEARAELTASVTSGGKAVITRTLEVSRGVQRLWLDFGGKALSEGGYTISFRLAGASAAGDTKRSLRVVEDPWKG